MLAQVRAAAEILHVRYQHRVIQQAEVQVVEQAATVRLRFREAAVQTVAARLRFRAAVAVRHQAAVIRHQVLHHPAQAAAVHRVHHQVAAAVEAEDVSFSFKILLMCNNKKVKK